jgi:hypothetical protein
MAKEIEPVDVDLIEHYLDWKINMQLRERDYGPERYAEHMALLRNENVINKALEMLDKYNKGTDWNQEMLDSLAAILRSNK